MIAAVTKHSTSMIMMMMMIMMKIVRDRGSSELFLILYFIDSDHNIMGDITLIRTWNQR